MSNVSVGFSAQPNQVLDAYRKIEEAAKRANKELKSMADIDFPGLDDARQELERINAGLSQMGSKLVRGSTAEAYRAGVRGGAYQGGDIVSVLRGMRGQYPDEAAYQREVQKLMRQAGNLANLGGFSGGGGGGGEAAGGGGFGGFIPMAKSMLGIMGIGTGIAFGAKKLGDAGSEATGTSDLRRQIGAIDTDFERFRDTIRKSSDALGVGVEETIRLNREYAKLSGAMSGESGAGGTNAGIRLARLFGLDVGQGVGMMGRASWLNVGGSSPKDQARLLAEAMAGSNLGGRQADAAEAMLRFAERSASVLGDAGNTQGFKGLFAALINSGHAGIRANAENILSGYDQSVRAGGRAGDAGKNFIYNTLSRNGVSDPFDVEYALEGGFTGSLGGGKMIGPELIRAMRSRYGGNRKMLLSAMKGMFGGSMHHAEGALEAFDTHKDNPEALKAKIAEIERSLNEGDPGTKARIAATEQEKALTEALDGLVDPLSELKEEITKMVKGVNHLIELLPDWSKTKETVKGGALYKGMSWFDNWLKTPAPESWSGAKINGWGGTPMKSGMNRWVDDPEYLAYLGSIEQQFGLEKGTLYGMLMTESRGGDPNFMKSGKGALGGFQFMPDTAKEFGLSDPMDKRQAAVAAARKLKGLMGRYGNLDDALLGYHTGEGNVANGNIGPEGRAYAPSVRGHMEQALSVQVEVIHKDSKGREIGRERKPAGRIAVPRMSGVTGGW